MATSLGELVYNLILNDEGFAGQVAAADAQVASLGIAAEESGAKMDASMAQGGEAVAASGKAAETSGFNFKSLALGAAAVAVGIGFVADKTVKAATDYQASLTQLVTGAGESESNIGMIGQGLLQMSGQVGESTKQLTDGLFMIESAGYHGAAGLDVLQAASEGAKVGNADLGTVADATTTIMKDFGGTLPTQAVNTLIATVANGKTHMEDLATSLAMIAPTASSAGVSLNDMMGAMATMTGEGVPAANAATYLRQTIIGLDAPSAGAKKAMEDVGLSSAAVATEMQKSLPNALAMITDAVGKKFPAGTAQYMQAIKDISGGSKTMQGMLDLTGTHMKDFTSNVASVSGAVKDGGSTIQGWAQTQQDAAVQEEKLKASIDAAGISIGEGLLPVVTSITEKVTAFVTEIGQWITAHQGLATRIIEAIAILSTLVIGILTAVKVVNMIAAAATVLTQVFLIATNVVKGVGIAIELLTSPIFLVVAAVAVLAYELATHWKQVTADAKAFGQDFMDAFSQVPQFFKGLATLIGDALLLPFEPVILAVNAVISAMDKVPGVKIPLLPQMSIPKFADGVTNFSGGLALVGEEGPELVSLPGGSSVYPNGTGPHGAGTTNITINAQAFMGNQAEARAFAELISRYQKRYAGQIGGTI